jgi:tRNA pseudouridine55 synthase
MKNQQNGYNSQMQKLVAVYKPMGLTPYQLIQRFKEKYPEYQKIPIGFAGRLDPLAHGVLLLMIGEETKNKDTYLGLTKAYQFEAVFGMQTDSYDVMGYVQERQVVVSLKQLQNKINVFIKKHTGKQTMPYPPFSSKTVEGKPLFWWTRKNMLSEINIPERTIDIYRFACLSISEITREALQQKINQAVSQVNGDFRQEEILEKWNIFFTGSNMHSFKTAKFSMHCSSGTYVRSIVHNLGQDLGTGAVTMDILRTKVGEYTLPSTAF